MKNVKLSLLAAAPFMALAMSASGASAADAVCATSPNQGVICLTPDGMKSYGRNSELRSNRVSDLITCGDKIVAVTNRSVASFDGAKWKVESELPRGLYGSAIACDKDGHYWVTSSRTVGYWNGDAWKLFQARDFLKGVRTVSIKGVAAGPNGTAWVVGFGGVAAHYDGNGWKVYKKDQGFKRSNIFNKIMVDSQGKVWLPGSSALMTFKDGNWVEVVPRAGTSAIVEGKDGNIWVASGTRLNRVNDGAIKPFKAPFTIRDIAIDGKGRIWAATLFGLAVKDGDNWQSRQMHNSALPVNTLYRVAVLGNGVDLPEKVQKEKGSVSGRVEWQNGDPVANAEIEICGVSKGIIFFGRGGPCNGQPLAATAKTDADGKFTFMNIEASSYRFAIKPVESKRWIRIFMSRNRMLIKPGQTKKIGTVRLNDRYRKKK